MKVNFIQCGACGVVVGVMDWTNVDDAFLRVGNALSEAAHRAKHIEARLVRIEASLMRR
ncbi:MAG TPA: hypothetical protein VHO06_03700 [Polyangia bacterium]|nr:hypothetical protein [Polyangia bacterium]